MKTLGSVVRRHCHHAGGRRLLRAAAPRNGRRRPWQPRCALAGGLSEGAPARPGRGGGHGGAQAPPWQRRAGAAMAARGRFHRQQRRETAAAGPGSPGVPSLEVCPRAHQPALAAGAGMGAGRRRRSERRRRHGSSWALSPAAAPRNGRRWPWQPRCALAGGLPEGAPARPGRGGGHGGEQAPPQRAPAILTSPALHEKQSTQNPKIRANCNKKSKSPGKNRSR